MGIDGRERGRRARLGYLSSGPRVPSDVTDRNHMPSATVSIPCFKPATVATRSHVYHRDLRSFEIRFEFESAVTIRFDSTVMGRFGRVCPLLVVVRRLKPLTALSGTVYILASSMSDHTPVLFNVFEPLRIGMRNL